MNLISKIAAVFVLVLFNAQAAIRAGEPETVHVTYHVQSGKLEEFLKVLKAHHPACLKEGLVIQEPHLILSGKEEGDKPVVIEILTWKDGDAPDSVSEHHPAVKKIWDQLNALTEKRGDKRSIEIEIVELVAGGGSTKKPSK